MSQQGKTVFALIDANNFFVSCEKVFRPDLNGKPVAVLSNNDGIIIARSAEVKQLGIPMAHPLHKVKDLLEAKDTTIFSANFRLYGDFSRRIQEVIAQYSPDIEVYSVDESFVDLSHLNVSDYQKLVSDMRQKILDWTGIPVSIGIAPSKTLAKAASEYAKKHPESSGVFSAMDNSSAETVLNWLPVEDVWGIGFRWGPRLIEFGIRTGKDFTGLDQKWVHDNLSVRGLRTWKELQGESCIALSESVYVDSHEQKSMQTTRLFGRSVRNLYELEIASANHAARLAAKLRRRKQIAWKMTVYVQTKNKPYKTISKTLSLPYPTSDTAQLISYAIKGLNIIYDNSLNYRRIGVVLTDLSPETTQQLTFEQTTDPKRLAKRDVLMRSIDTINSRYGPNSVMHGSQGEKKRPNWYSKRQFKTPDYTTNWSQLPKVKA